MKYPFKSVNHRALIALVVSMLAFFSVLYTLTAASILFTLIYDRDAGSVTSLFIVGVIFGPSTVITTVLVSTYFVSQRRPTASVFKASDISDVARHGLFGGLLNSSILVAIPAIIALSSIGSNGGEVRDFMVFGLFTVLLIGIPVGVGYSLLLRKPLQLIASWPTSHNTFLETARVVGAWMARQGLIAAALLAGSLKLTMSWQKTGILLLVLIWIVIAAVGLGFISYARREMGRRYDWVAKVAAGAISNYLVIPTNEVQPKELDDLRPLSRDGRGLLFVLARRTRGPSQGIYRTSEQIRPVALVHLPADLATKAAQSR